MYTTKMARYLASATHWRWVSGQKAKPCLTFDLPKRKAPQPRALNELHSPPTRPQRSHQRLLLHLPQNLPATEARLLRRRAARGDAHRAVLELGDLAERVERRLVSRLAAAS